MKIIRSDTEAAAIYLNETEQNNFNLIYVDANHQYEKVFDDLYNYQKFLASDYGCFQLNDCCHSDEGVKHNLSVLEASLRFWKIFDFIPLLITNTDFTDVLFAKRGSPIIGLVDTIVSTSDISYVEIPDQLFGSMKIKYGSGKINLSFK